MVKYYFRSPYRKIWYEVNKKQYIQNKIAGYEVKMKYKGTLKNSKKSKTLKR